MAFNIKWTKRAKINFGKIVKHLESSFGEKTAKAFVQKSFVITEILSEYPQIGSVEINEKKVRGIIITKHNKLFYRFNENEIIILNIFDTRQDPKEKRL